MAGKENLHESDGFNGDKIELAKFFSLKDERSKVVLFCGFFF